MNAPLRRSGMARVWCTVHTDDLSITLSSRFIYADDIRWAFQVETFSKSEFTQIVDVEHQQWHLKPSTSKNVRVILHGIGSHCELDAYINGQRLRHDSPTHSWSCVTWYRILSYREHLTCSATTLKSRSWLSSLLALHGMPVQALSAHQPWLSATQSQNTAEIKKTQRESLRWNAVP